MTSISELKSVYANQSDVLDDTRDALREIQKKQGWSYDDQTFAEFLHLSGKRGRLEAKVLLTGIDIEVARAARPPRQSGKKQ